jgi:hypothetical protein
MCQPVVLATNQWQPVSIAVDNTDVFWTDFLLQTVSSVPKGGGMANVLASAQLGADGLATDGTNVYWSVLSNTPSLLSIPVGGGVMPTTLASVIACDAIAVDGTNVYYTSRLDSTSGANTGSVLQLDKATNAVIPLASGQNQPASIAVNGTTVFWGNSDAVTGILIGGTISTSIAAGQVNVNGVALGANVYWTTQAVADCGVNEAPLNGSAAPVLLGAYPGCARPWGVVVDSSFAYWTDASLGTVMKVPIGGGTPVTLASGLAGPFNMAQDLTAIYWVDADLACTAACATSNVMKLAK